MCEEYRYYLSPSKKIHLAKDGRTSCAIDITEKWIEMVDLYWDRIFQDRNMPDDSYEICTYCDRYRAMLYNVFAPFKHSKFIGHEYNKKVR